jgi:hypothetical protein
VPPLNDTVTGPPPVAPPLQPAKKPDNIKNDTNSPNTLFFTKNLLRKTVSQFFKKLADYLKKTRTSLFYPILSGFLQGVKRYA